MYPLSNQKSPLIGKLREIRQPFFNSEHRKWNSQNLQQIVQNLLNFPTPTMNHMKFMESVPISQCSLNPIVKQPKFAAFAYFAILADFVHFAQMEINPGWSKISEIQTIH